MLGNTLYVAETSSVEGFDTTSNSAARDYQVSYPSSSGTSECPIDGLATGPGSLYVGQGDFDPITGSRRPWNPCPALAPFGIESLEILGAIDNRVVVSGRGVSPVPLAVFDPLTVPVNTVTPAISGTPAVGSTLSCSTGQWTQEPAAYSYAWTRDGAPIPGASTSSYVVAAADTEHALACVVTASNTAGSATAPSASVTATHSPTTKPHRPVISALRQSERVWTETRAGSRATHTHATPFGTMFTFKLNERARVTLAFARRAPGRRVGKRCVRQEESNGRRRRCTLTASVHRVSITGRAGANRYHFSGRIAGKRLKAGRYLLTATAAAHGAPRSAPRSLAFRISPGTGS